MTPTKTIPVEAPSSLLDALAGALPGYKKTTLRNFLKHGAVCVNGEPSNRANHPLVAGDEVSVLFSSRGEREGQADEVIAPILYEDEAILVLNKPAGLLSVPAPRGDEECAYHLLNERLKARWPRERAYIVHRIDRDTSGLLLFAKSDAARHALKNDWRNVGKRYLAATEGVPEPREGTIRSRLLERADLSVSSVEKSEKSRLAVTHYKVVAAAGNLALLEVRLETGRKNQIRVHLSELGFPVAGDKKYGARANPAGRLALHAWKLELTHPETGERLKFEAPFPPELAKLVPAPNARPAPAS